MGCLLLYSIQNQANVSNETLRKFRILKFLLMAALFQALSKSAVTERRKILRHGNVRKWNGNMLLSEMRQVLF